MKKRSVFSFALHALLPLLLLFAACSGGNSGGGSEPMASVGITLKQAENAQSKPGRFAVKTENITSLEIVVRSEDGNELARGTAPVEAGTTVTLTLNVPVGNNRIFTAEATDAAGQVILFGDAVTDLQEGQAIVLPISVEAPLQIAPENTTVDLGATQEFTATRGRLLGDPLQWTVNGIIGGDPEVGTIITTTDDTTAEYTAPANAGVPALAQVSVRVESADNAARYFHEAVALINDPAKTLFVDPVEGVDSDDCGAETAPCLTLTRALSAVETGGTVLLLPGTYVFGSGTGNETLPLQMKTGVTIHGTTQGGMAVLDFTDAPISGPGILGADEATLSGFRIETHSGFGNLIETQGTSPTIQDNLFFGSCNFFTENCNNTAIFVDQASAPVISGNVFGAIPGPNSFFNAVQIVGESSPQIINNDFRGNWVALLIQDNAAPRIENNRVIENREGVVAENNALPDLGGGASNGAGLNILSCNTEVDLFNDTFNTIFAQNNQWDHAPPEVFSMPIDGADIAFSGGDVNRDNATLYTFAPCNLGVLVSTPFPAFTTEGGGTVSFDLVLGTQPSADVIIALSSSDTTEGTVSPGSLTFTNQNWNILQTVTVTGVDDAVADGAVNYQIDFDLSGSLDFDYQNATRDPIALFNTDDETPGITVAPISGLLTTEAGGTDTFTIVLDSAPTSDVTITLNSDDATEGIASPNNLVFTTGNWNTAQTVTVTGQNDNVADGDVTYNIVTTVSTNDAFYAQIDPADVSVTNTDNDAAGITLSRTVGLLTDEGGASDTFTVVLDSEPTASVSIGLSSSDTTEGTVLPAGVSFDASNWNVPQTVTVTGANDDIADGNIGYTIVTAAATSTDTTYNGVDAADVSATNNDNDNVGIIVNPTTGLVTTEAGVSATFTIVLASEPTADVTIALASNDATEGRVSPPGLTFNASDWNMPKTVTVTGVNDDVDDGNQAYTIETATASSGDTGYNGINPDDVSVSNTDDDTANIILNKTTVLTDEGGTSDLFTIVLDSEPTADVMIALASSDETEGRVSPPGLTFNASDWNTPKTVTVTGVNDDVADGNVSYTITTATTSTDTIYAAIDPPDVAATNNDDDVVGITVTPTSGLVTTEAGGTATFSVVLTSQPTATVNIPLSSSDTAEGTISTDGLSFDASNWNTPQMVTVTGIDDAIADGPVPYTIFTAAATGGDYAGFDAADVSVTNNDNDIAGITVNPTAGLVTTEAGGIATFTVVLNTQPNADVVIGLSSDTLSEGTLSASSLTFTAGNWASAQTVTVTGVDDAVDDGDQAYTILTAAAVSSDTTGYSGMNADDVAVTNTDNDAAGITLSRTAGLLTDEGGASDTFTVVLDSEPTASVSIGLSSSDTTEGTVLPASVSFDASNWNVPQTVTVTGANDDIADGNIGYTIVTAAATSTDTTYNGVDAADVSVTNNDNDSVGIIVTPVLGLTTSEAGAGTDTFTIRLNSEPTGNVTIGLSSSDLSEGTISTGSVTFTATDWDTAQTVTVTGVNDDVDDGDINYTIFTAAATSTDTAYNGIDPDNVFVTNTDDDAAGVSIVPTSGLITTESGGNATFTMALTSEPTADVTIALSSDTPSEGTVSPNSLTFTSFNWNTPQTVTVTGVDDFVIDGHIPYQILTAAAVSSDANYSGFDAQDVGVTNRDNDSADIVINPMSGLETTEAGGTDTFTVVLSSLPSANVTVRLSSSDMGEGTVSPVSLTFTPGNWNAARTVTVTGVNDGIADGDQPYNIITAAAVSTDVNYNNLNPSDVSVTNLDNDFRLTVNVIGGGSVTLLPGTINCGTSCIADFVSGTRVTLRTANVSGWTFDSWSGDCSGTLSPTTVTMDADKNCTANMRRTLLLNVDFDSDDAQKPPNLNPPGDPVGDRLTLNESAGTILVQQINLGAGSIKYALFNQVAGQQGGLDLSAFVAGTAPRTGRYIVRWRSSASTRNLSFASMVIRDSLGRILMNISYRPNGILDLNDQNPDGIGIPWSGAFQFFEITVNLDTQSIDDISIDGKPPGVTFPLPFRENAIDLDRFSLELGLTSAQSLGLDDIGITLLQ